MLPRLSLALLLCLTSLPLRADTLRVAVASNARALMQDIAQGFSATSGVELQLSFASTGVHYAQLRQGAPFDAWFAADVERPRRAEQEGLAIAGSRITWAIGQLVLWSPREGLVDDQGQVLADESFRFLALANPRFAPYGAAARQTLQSLGLWERLEGRLVMGENVAQALQFVDSGNAELGLVAWSMLQAKDGPSGSWWLVPNELHQPIEQQAVILRDGADVRALFDYLRGDDAHALLRQHGYLLP